MNGLGKFIKSTGIYLLGSVLTKVTSFLMLPLYTKYLTPTEYGNFDLYTAYITFLCSILFLDIWGGVMRFMFDYKTNEEKAKPVTIGLFIFTSSSIVYALAVILFGTVMNIPFKGLLLLYGLTMNMVQFVGYIARAQGKNIGYALGGLVGTIISILLNILFIAVLKRGYQYLYIAYCIGNIVNILIVGSDAKIFDLIIFRNFDKVLLREMLRFSLPLSINSAAYWFLTSYNRVVISNQLSTADNGLYAIANKFGSMVNLFTQCFQMAWQELSFSKAGSNKKEMDKFYTTAFNEYLRLMWIGTLIIISCVKVIFPIMIGSEFELAEPIVPGALLATFFTCISSFLGSIMTTIKKNDVLFFSTGIGAIVNVILINFLIKMYGIHAANIALSCGFACVCIARVLLLKKYLDIKLKYRWVVLLILGTCIVFIVYLNASRFINAILGIVIITIAFFIYRKQIYNGLNIVTKR
ncbi:polysaccharide biosynthesis C-terminal domain-containing protein [Clostridium sp. MSJ-11]|uniref:Polysaccharide biosynthesis C-terminal domain-containing protein n=1 Tax=Clostridium mobile TaxID=2841512 RepID=A0ABS6EKM2_9CLOT|nr:polysaccharide biosynthesis C-terminal domain-containing protein [Clostridium mobile]MBU5485764.1 polysaccharide biosynthesis C-terminal domain-containing protein [Clostridium mobile]